jgi:F-type H+-transporting ATPase subunit a
VDELILAIEECDLSQNAVCAPGTVTELFEFRTPIFSPFGFPITRTVFLILLAAVVVIALVYFGLRKKATRPSKYQLGIESLMTFIRDEIAIGIIGPVGIRYYPYLAALFLFILIGNAFEITPFINFPITSRMAIPMFLALLTWVIFVAVGFKRNGIGYLLGIIWPPGVPVALKPLVGIIEFFSTFFVRPFSLAVRLFANLVAGHVMLSLLLTTAFVSFSAFFAGDISATKAMFGFAWWGLALGIFVFEIIVIMLQAYIFTLLSAVYIETSVNAEH